MKSLHILFLVLAALPWSVLPSIAQSGPNVVDGRNGLSYSATVRTLNTSSSVSRDDHTLLANATDGAITVTLPAIRSKWIVLVIKKTDSSTNAVTVTPSSGNTIDLASSYSLTGKFQQVTLQATSSGDWAVLSSGTLLNGDVTIAPDVTGGNLGASSTLKAVVNTALIPTAALTNGAASVKTKALMDDTPAAEFSAVTVTAAPTDTQDATIARIGTNSLKLAWPSTSVAGDGIAFTAFSAENWEAQESVGFWLYVSEAIAAGDLTFVTVDSTGDVAFNIPAVATANKWTWVEVDISSLAAGTGDAVTNYKILLSTAGATAHAAFSSYIDGAWKWDATEETALGVDLIDQPGAVRSVLTVLTAETGANTFAALVEGTDYFVHSESGNDFLVTITDQSTKSAIVLAHHK